MKALSLRQPWLHAVLHMGKRIENRVAWKGCAYRGPILLHASKGIGTQLDFTEDCDALGEILGEEAWSRFRDAHLDTKPHRLLGAAWLPRSTLALALGGICGRARIDGVIRSEADFAAYGANTPGGEDQRRWWFGTFALVLADVEPLPFVAWPGMLGLFDVDPRALPPEYSR